MDREKYLDKIRKLQFFAIDLNLYLDNFPECSKATEDYKFISSKLAKLVCEYESKYGPLTNFGSASNQDPEAWINTPWPWERVRGDK